MNPKDEFVDDAAGVDFEGNPNYKPEVDEEYDGDA